MIAQRVLAVLIVAALAYGTWVVLLFAFQRPLMFPSSLVNARSQPAPAWVETWKLAHPDGVHTESWFVPAANPARAAPATRAGPPTPVPGERRPALVLFHGNAMLVHDWLSWADFLSAGGLHVLLPEFRGYGACEGTPSREALVADALRAVARLRDDPRVDPERIALYGRSIGGAIAAEVAARLDPPPAALLLHTAPARTADLAFRYGAPGALVRDRFDAEGALRSLRARQAECEIVVIGHRQDELIPRSHTLRLAAAAGVSAIEIDGDHGRARTQQDEDAVQASIHGTLERAVRTPRPHVGARR
jgi:pimeloyl-ACP methyl ester carboxylesterase